MVMDMATVAVVVDTVDTDTALLVMVVMTANTKFIERRRQLIGAFSPFFDYLRSF